MSWISRDCPSGFSLHDPPVKKPVKPKIREELRQQQAEQRCFRAYAGYLHLLEDWRKRYAPQTGGYRLAPAVCGVAAKTGLCGISAGHAADRHRGRKSGGRGWHKEGGGGA